MPDEPTRTYSWIDPMPPATKGVQMSSLDYMRALANGEIAEPPIAMTLDFSWTKVLLCLEAPHPNFIIIQLA